MLHQYAVLCNKLLQNIFNCTKLHSTNPNVEVGLTGEHMKICDECDTVAHCAKHGCIPKVPAKDAMKLALEALEGSTDKTLSIRAITALREALAEQPAPVQEPVPEAMKIVIEAMRADPDYAWSWHCNIAMAFVDAGGDHYTGNQGAARFMKMLANVAPAHELPSPLAQRNQLSVDEIFEAIRPLYSSDKAAWLAVNHSKDEYRAIEAAHGIGVEK